MFYSLETRWHAMPRGNNRLKLNVFVVTQHKQWRLPSALEQIAVLKLFHIPKALEKGVGCGLVD